MDIPFAPHLHQPTTAPSTYTSSAPLCIPQLTLLSRTLATHTTALLRNPYDPSLWLSRTTTLSSLSHPELAVGDAWKASLLCTNLLETLQRNTRPNFRLGWKAGFWMRGRDEDEEEEEKEQEEKEEDDDDGADLDAEHDAQIEKFAHLLHEAEGLVVEHLSFAPGREEGEYVPREYPWVRGKWRRRGEEVFGVVEREFREQQRGIGGVRCLPRRDAFGDGVREDGEREVWGVFAERDLREGEVVLVDRSRIWGCAGPGTGDNLLERSSGDDDDSVPMGARASNLYGGVGCTDELHPNDTDDAVEHDLRWIRDAMGAHAPHHILMARCLLTCIQDSVAHPLSHPLIARLTPHYSPTTVKTFSRHNDIALLNTALLRFGIDIFANPAFDTWVLFVLEARVANNAWSDPQVTCLSPLFSLFNHSCEPNVGWRTLEDHRTLVLEAKRDVAKGEQLFVEYDAFQHQKGVRERRAKLRRWLSGDCQCGRCGREAGEEEAIVTDGVLQGCGVDAGWAEEQLPELPEDFVVGGKWDVLWREQEARRVEMRNAEGKEKTPRVRRTDSLSP